MHLATLKTTADKIAGILQEKTAPVAGQGSIQLLKKETDGPPLDASKPKPPISTRLPLSGKEVRRETQSESRVTPVIEQPAEPLPATPTASAHSFATFDALAVQKKESAATSLVLIGTAALLIIVGSATWAYWKRTAPPAVDAVTSVQPAQPATPTAEVVAQPAEPAPQIEVPAQRLNRTAIERANATSQLPAGPTRSAKPLEVAPSKSTATLSATKEPTPLPSAADVATPGSNSTQPLQQFALVGANSMTPPQTPPPDLVLAPKQTPILQSDVVPARVVRSVPPQYPPFAKQKGATGTVVVQAKVAKNGSLTDLKFLSGPPIFRQAALDAVKLWQYKPATLNGQVFEQEVDIKLEFRPNSR